jgi:hypothetical protein
MTLDSTHASVSPPVTIRVPIPLRPKPGARRGSAKAE